jgi:hypothetical protein
VLDDAVDTQAAQHHKPHHHHRPEQLADTGGAMFLNQKQPHQHNQGQRHDPMLQAVEGQFKPLDGR